MKNIIILFCFLLFDNSSNAQTGVVNTIFDYQIVSTTQHDFIFQTYFSLGYQSTCPSLINSTVSIIDNTLYVYGYYDLTGPWPFVGCQSTDTVTYNYAIPSNITHIIMSTNVIGYNNTPPYIPSTITYQNVHTRDFDLSLMATNKLVTNKLKVSPNPTTGSLNINFGQLLDQATLKLTNVFGQIVLSKTINNLESTTFEINEPSGIYFLEIESQNNIKQVVKIIMQ